MSIGSPLGRLFLCAGLVAALLVWDVVVPWVRQRLLLRRLASEEGAAACPGAVSPDAADTSGSVDGSDAAPPADIAGEGPGGPAAVRKDAGSMSGADAQKAWAAARELPHQYIPDWKHDEDYLTLLNEAATGGSVEAMNKLAEYAFRRKAYVEAYYWKLKVEMVGGKVLDFMASDVLAAWVASGCPTQYRNVMRGFSEEQGMFARAVMRLKAGIDVPNAAKRLKLLAKDGNADVQQYMRIGKNSRANQANCSNCDKQVVLDLI